MMPRGLRLSRSGCTSLDGSFVKNGLLARAKAPRPARGSRAASVTATSEKIPVDQLLSVAKEAAGAGAKVVMDGVDKPRQISYKGLTDLVTDTDQASEDAVLAALRSAFPDHAVLGEEGGVSGNTSSDYLWCVDPLDGTTNFAHGYPSFGVSVGVLRHAIPVAACVVEFAGGPGLWSTRTFTASRNHGAFADGKRITVSKVTGFGYQHDEPWVATMDLFKHFTDVSQGVRRLGAAAVDLCHVGLGITESFFEYRLKPWDVAAGVLVVEEAGGLVTTMDGCAYSVFDRSVLATNGAVHGAIQVSPKLLEEMAVLHDGIELLGRLLSSRKLLILGIPPKEDSPIEASLNVKQKKLRQQPQT